jgi:alkylation response protein AidB-like acyl-CoA dehydrogenase
MNFGLSETQQAIKDSAREFLSKEAPLAHVRALMEGDTAFDGALWRKCAEQGYLGMPFDERYGGVGLGAVEMAALLEEMGRSLTPGPFISTVLLAGTALSTAGNETQKQRYLAPLCRGESCATLALLERNASWDHADVRLEASANRSGFQVSGEKLFVPDVADADVMIVAARIAPQADLALLCVPSNAPGLRWTLTPAVDLTRRLYRVTFDRVQIPADDLLAQGDKAAHTLARALDVAAAGLAAEMVGGMQALLDLTVGYAKTRSQFGRPIGSFQAVQHRCVDMLALLEGSRSAAYYAAWTLSQNDADACRAVSVAKAYASEAFREVGNLAIQVHGGMGFTWENDAHLYYRRAKGSELMCGDATFHRTRIARSLFG